MDLPRNATFWLLCVESPAQKEHTAEELKKSLKRKTWVGIFSTDNIFYNADGEYEFVPYALGAAHAFMRHELIFSMRMREYDVYFQTTLIFQRWNTLTLSGKPCLNISPYLFGDLREGPNYGNIHGVPEDRVKKMLDDSDNSLPFSR